MIEIKQHRLTTIDNPYDPFDQFEEWFQYDVQHSYNCCGLVALLAETSDSMTEQEKDSILFEGMKQLIETDPLNQYTIVEREVSDDLMAN